MKLDNEEIITGECRACWLGRFVFFSPFKFAGVHTRASLPYSPCPRILEYLRELFQLLPTPQPSYSTAPPTQSLTRTRLRGVRGRIYPCLEPFMRCGRRVEASNLLHNIRTPVLVVTTPKPVIEEREEKSGVNPSGAEDDVEAEKMRFPSAYQVQVEGGHGERESEEVTP